MTAFTPAKLGKLKLKNRILKAATFEGMSPDGKPSERLLGFHERLAQGGVAMTTVSYCTTEADGRIMDSMLYMHEGIRPQLTELISRVHGAGAKVSGQMAHCGHFSKNKNLQRLKNPQGPSRQFNPIGMMAGRPFAGEMNHADIDYLVETYRNTTKFMRDVGFDAIEIHFGHGYGLSQFISPKTNKRTDEYGGSLINRMRLALRVLDVVKEAAGDLPVLGKISMTDGVKGGVDWDEGFEMAKVFDKAGIDALIPSAGTSSFNPMIMFRGESINHGMVEMESNPLIKLGLKMIGPFLHKNYPYEELYLRQEAMRINQAVSCPVIYIGGCSTRESLDKIINEGFEFVQLGRALLKDPDFVVNAQAKKNYVSGCTHCNRCVPLIEHPEGIGCVLNDEKYEKAHPHSLNTGAK